MNKKTLIKKMKEVLDGIETDNYTRNNLQDLMNEIDRKGLKCD